MYQVGSRDNYVSSKGTQNTRHVKTLILGDFTWDTVLPGISVLYFLPTGVSWSLSVDNI